MQRHNELLGVVEKAPSEISEIVARRRKDFTREFFEHLYAVAQSYYDDTDKQNGETVIFLRCVVIVHSFLVHFNCIYQTHVSLLVFFLKELWFYHLFLVHFIPYIPNTCIISGFSHERILVLPSVYNRYRITGGCFF